MNHNLINFITNYARCGESRTAIFILETNVFMEQYFSIFIVSVFQSICVSQASRTLKEHNAALRMINAVHCCVFLRPIITVVIEICLQDVPPRDHLARLVPRGETTTPGEPWFTAGCNQFAPDLLAARVDTLKLARRLKCPELKIPRASE